MNLYTKQYRLREQPYGYQGVMWGEEIVKEFRMDMHTLLYLKWITKDACSLEEKLWQT